MSILIFILIIGIIVTSHELGHFLLAKANGIVVKEFFIGMGPSLFSIERGGTKYSLKLLPIGGACVFEGEDGKTDETSEETSEVASGNLANTSERTSEERVSSLEGAFPNASVWARISTVAAGPIFNFILAFVLAFIIVGNTYSDKPVVQDVMPGFPAEEAGMQAGDLITRMDGERIYLSREVGLITMLKNGQTLEVEYMRDGKKYHTTLVPKYDAEKGKYYIGLLGYAEYFKCSPSQLIPYSYYEVRYGVKATVKSLLMILQGKAKKEDVSGPVGIAALVDDVTEQTKPYGFMAVLMNLMNLAMLLSVNLGIINFLPLPALDGGRLIFLLLEVVRGKPIPPEKEGVVHLAGFAALMVLMVFVVYNDIMKLIH